MQDTTYAYQPSLFSSYDTEIISKSQLSGHNENIIEQTVLMLSANKRTTSFILCISLKRDTFWKSPFHFILLREKNIYKTKIKQGFECNHSFPSTQAHTFNSE